MKKITWLMDSSPKKSDTLTELNVLNSIFFYQSQLQQNAQDVIFIYLIYQNITPCSDKQSPQ